MLLHYVVKNYMSIGNEFHLSMLPVEGFDDSTLTVNVETKHTNQRVLKKTVLLGPNASGKSNLIKSIEFAKKFIVKGIRSDTKIRINQFKGCFEEFDGVTSFQFMIYSEGNIYDFGFALNQDQVCEEWLNIDSTGGMQEMFERVTNEEGITNIKVLPSLAQPGKLFDRIELIQESMGINQRNQLFINKLYEHNVEKIEPVINWFRKIAIIYPNSKYAFKELKIMGNEDFGNVLCKYDTGIERTTVNLKSISLHELKKMMDLPEKVIEDIEDSHNTSGFIRINDNFFKYDADKKEMNLFTIKNIHVLNGKEIPFSLEEESDGTKRLFDLLPISFIGDSNVIFIDEIDRSLHTKLTKKLIKDFSKNNEAQSQLIFTSHDVNIIDFEIFRYDEIKFIEKNNIGESTTWTLSDYDIDENNDFLKDYLNGRFGAIPNFI